MAPSMLYIPMLFLFSVSATALKESAKISAQVFMNGEVVDSHRPSLEAAGFPNVRPNLTRKEVLRTKQYMNGIVRPKGQGETLPGKIAAAMAQTFQALQATTPPPLTTATAATPLTTFPPQVGTPPPLSTVAALAATPFLATGLGTAPQLPEGTTLATPNGVMPARGTLDGKPLLPVVGGLQIHKLAASHPVVTSHPLAALGGTDIEYVAVNAAGMPQYALTKVSASTARFYNVLTGQRVALVQAGSGGILGGTQYNILGYVPGCVTQKDEQVTDAVQGFKTYLRYVLAKGGGCMTSTCWTASRANCDSQPGDTVWDIQTTEWIGPDFFTWDYNILETSSHAVNPQVGVIKQLYTGIADSLPNTSESVYNVWLGGGQDQALGVLITALMDYTGSLSNPGEEKVDGAPPVASTTPPPAL